MNALTEQVFHLASTHTFKNAANAAEIIEFIKDDIKPDAHIETFLTHLSDLISLAERSRNLSVAIGAATATKAELTFVHLGLLKIIAEIIRWGFKTAVDGVGEEVGEPHKSITDVAPQKNFIKALFHNNRAGLEKHRGAVEFFTTNYDTLIEDGLALNQVSYCDGFNGGAVGFWKAKFDTSQKAVVTKLHGSIDWFRSSVTPQTLLRIRYGDSYHSGETGAVMIYPQASKYSHAQDNPFAGLFDRFRKRLADGTDNVLFICGYSFGDDHINADIDLAMSREGSQLTIIVFCYEGESGLPACLEGWRTNRSFKDRVYIASPNGIYRGSSDPCFPPSAGTRDWWTFSGMTELFSKGLPQDIQEALQ